MRTITVQALEQDPSLFQEIVQVLRDDGLVCFPFRRQYSIAAALQSEAAVLRLVQSKRRSEKAPSLVLIPDRAALDLVADTVPALANDLIGCFWPGQLTIQFAPRTDLPTKVLKTILAQKKNSKIGVRVPEQGIQLQIVQAFGAPLLTSSANLSRKPGSGSVSSIRKSFNSTVEIMIDAGDLQAGLPSTVVDIDQTSWRMVREGSISPDQIKSALEPKSTAS